MHSVATDLKDHELIPKWIARGFWYCEHFIPQWSSSEHLPKNDDDPYYKIANRTIHDLSSLLFKGRSPSKDGTLEKIIENLKA